MNKVILSALVILISTPSYAWNSPKEESALLESDAFESQKIKPECDHFVTASADLMKSHLQKNEPLQTKKDYSLLLESFKKYPRTPEAASRGLGSLIAMPASYQDLNLDMVYKIYTCNPIAAFDAGKLLITSAQSLGLSNEEREDLAHSVLDHVTYDMTSGRPNLMTYLTDFNLVTLLMAGGFIEVSDPLYVELMHLDQEGAHLKRDLQNSRIGIKIEPNSRPLFSKLSKEDEKRERGALFKELEGVDSLQGKLVWLLRRIRIS